MTQINLQKTHAFLCLANAVSLLHCTRGSFHIAAISRFRRYCHKSCDLLFSPFWLPFLVFVIKKFLFGIVIIVFYVVVLDTGICYNRRTYLRS